MGFRGICCTSLCQKYRHWQTTFGNFTLKEKNRWKFSFYLWKLGERTRECKNPSESLKKTAFEAKGRLSDTTGKVIQRLFIIDLYTYLAIYRHGCGKR